MTVVVLTFAVGNIKGRPVMPTPDVESDIAKLFSIGADVTGAVEIDHPAYKEAFKAAAKDTAQNVYNLHTEEPAATARLVIRHWWHRIHDGFAKVTPPRFNAGVRLQSPIPLLVIVKHPVSGANRHGDAAKRTFRMRLRRRLFKLDVAHTGRLIRRRNRKGISVVVMQDSNNIRQTVYTDNQIIAARSGLMWITVHPAPRVGVDFPSDQETIKSSQLHTDHAFIAREIRFTSRP